MGLRPGSRWRSTRGSAEVVVVRAADDDLVLECAGAPMVLIDGSSAPATDEPAAGEDLLLLGKRYEHPALAVEVLCSKAGPGPLAINGEPLSEKSAKPLPSSD